MSMFLSDVLCLVRKVDTNTFSIDLRSTFHLEQTNSTSLELYKIKTGAAPAKDEGDQLCYSNWLDL